jgi:hypothetical protein
MDSSELFSLSSVKKGTITSCPAEGKQRELKIQKEP